MHHTGLSNLSPIETIFAVAALLLVLYIYFLPTITAIKRNSPYKTAVVIVNLLFGVTLLGWVIALVLASKQPTVVIYNTPPPPR
jgi:protein-S-isoprenylcysteine O-methyltransferase Ste14